MEDTHFELLSQRGKSAFVQERHCNSSKGCGYVVAVMAVYWITEVIPLSVTAMLPVILFPMVGIMPAKEASGAYMNDTCVLALGALIVAVAIELWSVHKRIALLVVRSVGSGPNRILLGMYLVTWALAVFISNTAVTEMMMITANSLLDMYKDFYNSHRQHKYKGHNGGPISDEYTRLSKAMHLKTQALAVQAV